MKNRTLMGLAAGMLLGTVAGVAMGPIMDSPSMERARCRSKKWVRRTARRLYRMF